MEKDRPADTERENRQKFTKEKPIRRAGRDWDRWNVNQRKKRRDK